MENESGLTSNDHERLRLLSWVQSGRQNGRSMGPVNKRCYTSAIAAIIPIGKRMWELLLIQHLPPHTIRRADFVDAELLSRLAKVIQGKYFER